MAKQSHAMLNPKQCNTQIMSIIKLEMKLKLKFEMESSKSKLKIEIIIRSKLEI